jgi:phenylacetate-CoA ligase
MAAIEQLERSLRPALARGWSRLRRPGAAALLERVRETQWLGAGELREMQLEALRELALAAGLLRPASLDDVADWPITTPATLPDVRAASGPGRIVSSSGTGGKPRTVLLSPEAVRWQEAVEERAREWLGAGGGRSRIWACCIEQTRSARLALAARNTLMFYAPELNRSPELRRRAAERTISRPPEILQGASNVLAVLAREIGPRPGARLPTLPLSAANHLTPWYRRALESTFSVTPRRRYAAVEPGLIAPECEHGSLHVNVESLLVEIAGEDGVPVAPGEVGDILITSLHNLASPLLRYRIGDVGRLVPEPCACGRSLPVLELQGRRHEIFRDATAAPVTPERLFAALDGDGGRIADARVERFGEGVRVKAVPEPDADRGALAEALAADVAAVLGLTRPAVEVAWVEQIETGESGKTLLLDAVGG